MAKSVHDIQRIQSEVDHLRAKNEDLQNKLVEKETLREEEAKTLQGKIDGLKAELERLNPGEGSGDDVCKLMDVCGALLDDMEKESYKKQQIMHDLSSYTASIIDAAAAEPELTEDGSAVKRKNQSGRVIELPDGSIVLRSYQTAEVEMQVDGNDLLKVDINAPVRYRSLAIRQLLTSFQGRQVLKMKLDELQNEVDKLYIAKIAADSEADAAGVNRSDLSRFVVEYYMDTSESIAAAQARLCGILHTIQSLERAGKCTPKVALFARFLEFCDYDKVLPLSILNICLQAKKKAQAAAGTSTSKVSAEALKNAGADISKLPNNRGGTNSGSVSQQGENLVTVETAWDSAVKALPNSGTAVARRELFAKFSQFAEISGPDSARLTTKDMKEFNIMILIIHDRLRKEDAPQMRELIARVESRGTATLEEFRRALADAQLFGVPEEVWRAPLLGPAGANTIQGLGALSSDAVLDWLGGGSYHRLPRASMTETHFMRATAEAACEDVYDSTEIFRKLWNRSKAGTKLDSRKTDIKFEDFRNLIQSVDPQLPLASARILYLAAAEASQSCFQYDSDACPIVGSLDTAPTGFYGGELVTLQLVTLGILKHLDLFNGKAKCASSQQGPEQETRKGHPGGRGNMQARSATPKNRGGRR
eukprot:TRINITY_DN11093_c0_g2_i1.p1 TRINITY_DN11093_c0_g2~~TRINITY_DN11093_c0_g2_i1.p1  ORF type:complete len:676 (-),score=151.47 TRINITY_DN11093_c0_g2_i1:57-2003(-)